MKPPVIPTSMNAISDGNDVLDFCLPRKTKLTIYDDDDDDDEDDSTEKRSSDSSSGTMTSTTTSTTKGRDYDQQTAIEGIAIAMETLKNDNQSLRKDVKMLKCGVSNVKSLLLNPPAMNNNNTMFKEKLQHKEKEEEGSDILLEAIHTMSTLYSSNGHGQKMILNAQVPIWDDGGGSVKWLSDGRRIGDTVSEFSETGSLATCGKASPGASLGSDDLSGNEGEDDKLSEHDLSDEEPNGKELCDNEGYDSLATDEGNELMEGDNDEDKDGSLANSSHAEDIHEAYNSSSNVGKNEKDENKPSITSEKCNSDADYEAFPNKEVTLGGGSISGFGPRGRRHASQTFRPGSRSPGLRRHCANSRGRTALITRSEKGGAEDATESIVTRTTAGTVAGTDTVSVESTTCIVSSSTSLGGQVCLHLRRLVFPLFGESGASEGTAAATADVNRMSNRRANKRRRWRRNRANRNRRSTTTSLVECSGDKNKDQDQATIVMRSILSKGKLLATSTLILVLILGWAEQGHGSGGEGVLFPHHRESRASVVVDHRDSNGKGTSVSSSDRRKAQTSEIEQQHKSTTHSIFVPSSEKVVVPCPETVKLIASSYENGATATFEGDIFLLDNDEWVVIGSCEGGVVYITDSSFQEISKPLSKLPATTFVSDPSDPSILPDVPMSLPTLDDDTAPLQTNLPSSCCCSCCSDPEITFEPTAQPTLSPSDVPTKLPTSIPTLDPSDLPTDTPSLSPTLNPAYIYDPPDHASEMESLQTIYNFTGGTTHWLNTTGWMTDTPHCQWYGIFCDLNGYVTQIQLRNNNVTGEFPSYAFSGLHKLKVLNLANNGIWGSMSGTQSHAKSGRSSQTTATGASDFDNLQALTHVYLSQNNLSGEVDVLFAPALEYVDFRTNRFTSVASFEPSKPSHKTLHTIILSDNSIQQTFSDLWNNAPPNIQVFTISNNFIHGRLAASSGVLTSLKTINMAGNRLSGTIPDLSTSAPNIDRLDMSNQKQDGNAGFTGFTGSIPESLSNLRFITALNLAGNSLSGTIPPALGSFSQLKLLDLSDNDLSSTIPPQLGKLYGDLEVLNISMNNLSGQIPSHLSQLQGASVNLNGNSKLLNPAPLDLCFFPSFDLKDVSAMCPHERNALKELYDSTNGGEWANNENWADPHVSHCDWHGITCNGSNNTIKIELSGNGLSGTLSKSIGDLSSVKELNLGGNGIKGSITSEIGRLYNIERLRLNHNSFVEQVPTELGNLVNLQLLHLNRNRLSNSIPNVIMNLPNDYSFISDCGKPSDRDEESTVLCEKCTMCCNVDGNCNPTKQTPVKAKFQSYLFFGLAFLAMVFFACLVLALAVLAHDRYKNQNLLQGYTPQSAMHERDISTAVNIIGRDSIYQFILGKSRFGWAIVLVTFGVQLMMLFVFVKGAEFSPYEDSDVPYSWKCPPDKDTCTDTSDLSPVGWAVFAISMGAHLLKDIVNGIKLIVSSARERHNYHHGMRLFFGGVILTSAAAFTLLISGIYNAATAQSNSEIILNCVAIVFVTDIDEYVYGILCAVNISWVKMWSVEGEEECVGEIGFDKDEEEDKVDLTSEMQNLIAHVESLQLNVERHNKKLKMVLQHFPDLKDGEPFGFC